MKDWNEGKVDLNDPFPTMGEIPNPGCLPPPIGTQQWMAELMRNVFEDQIMSLRDAGQKEYAHELDNCFANFERVAADVEVDRKKVLWTYFRKHIDGIASYLKGHRSQREDVRGRIGDAIVYLFLLRGMIEQEDMESIRENLNGANPPEQRRG